MSTKRRRSRSKIPASSSRLLVVVVVDNRKKNNNFSNYATKIVGRTIKKAYRKKTKPKNTNTKNVDRSQREKTIQVILMQQS